MLIRNALQIGRRLHWIWNEFKYTENYNKFSLKKSLVVHTPQKEGKLDIDNKFLQVEFQKIYKIIINTQN